MSSYPLHYEVHLISDVTFFARAGAGAEVDFVPGLVILGHLARAYDAAKARDLHWEIFHSGQTRFGDARKVSLEGHAARVIPLSFKFAKGANGTLENGRTFLSAFGPDANNKPTLVDAIESPDTKLKQDGAGKQAWPNGELVQVDARVDLKTSVLYASQRAREGALFSLISLTRGQAFRGTIVCATEEARTFIKDNLKKKARLGRSRRAEYGQAEIEWVDAIEGGWEQGERPDGGQRFLLLSDTCLLDPKTGLPTTTPDPTHFGLGGGTLDRDATCIRVSRFSPFNGHHRRPAMERVALRAGSVICFKDVTGPATGTETWIGAHTAEGLGHVWIDPPTLEGWRGTLDPRPKPLTDFEAPGDTLGLWLAAQHTTRDERAAAEASAEQIVAAMRAPKTPGPSQWRRLADQVRTHGVEPALVKVCKTGVAGRRWQAALPAFERAIEGKQRLAVALAAETLARTAGGDR